MDLVDTLDSILSSDTPEPHRILIIDDEKMAEYHSLILQNANLSVYIINDAKTVVDVIFNYKPDLILMDMVMPQCKGSELAQLIRQIPEFLSLPIVYLSSESNQAQFSALRVGADGFLTKPIDPARLVSEVLLRMERMEAIRTLMIRDSLTGLLNHTTILSALKSAIESAKRRNEPVCFAMLDG
jgi:PleD family two-component response regulator